MKPLSLRARLLGWDFLLLTAVTTVLLGAFHAHEREVRIAAEDAKLRHTLLLALPGVARVVHGRGEESGWQGGRPGAPARAPGNPAAFLRKLDSGDTWCLVFDHEGEIRYRSAGAPELDRPEADDALAAGNETIRVIAGQRCISHGLPGGELAMVGRSVAIMDDELTRLAYALAGIGFAITALGAAGAWIIAGRVLRPVRHIASTAERISQGQLTERIPTAGNPDELGRLVDTLNTTFDRLDDAREQVLRFTADASHELRTPLAVILAETQNALRRERTADEYRDTIAATERAARRMKALSDALLELARGDSAGDKNEKMPCDLADLVDETAAMLAPLAREHHATLATRLASCPVDADPMRLGRALINLVSNALLHNADGVTVTLAVYAEGAHGVVEVVDNGKGIPPEHRAHIFERFHRADASRTRHTGGAGLGLAIVKQTVESHGGDITAEETPGGGATFRIRIPLRRE